MSLMTALFNDHGEMYALAFSHAELSSVPFLTRSRGQKVFLCQSEMNKDNTI